MKKTLLVILMALFTSSILSGCGERSRDVKCKDKDDPTLTDTEKQKANTDCYIHEGSSLGKVGKPYKPKPYNFN